MEKPSDTDVFDVCIQRKYAKPYVLKVGYGHRVRRGLRQEIKGSKAMCFRSVDISLTKGNNQ